MSLSSVVRGLGPTRVFLAILTLGSLLHLAVAGRAELSQDEGHYALYARFLDWSYYDHPPLVGWVQAVALRFGDSELVVRLPAVLLGAFSVWLVFKLARELFPQAAWQPVIAVALLQGAGMLHLLWIGLLPDSLLVPAVLACTLCLHRAVSQGRSKYWLGVGLTMGLAGLAKYPAISLVVSTLLYLSIEKRWGELRHPWIWWGAAVAALLVSPVFYWNLGNDWASFGYQLGHGIGDEAWSAGSFLASQVPQFFLYGPALFVAGVAGLLQACRAQADSGFRLLALVALPILIGFALASGFEETKPYWTAAGWTVASIAAARWLSCHWERVWVQWLTKVSAGCSLVIVLFIHTHLFYPWLPFKENDYLVADLMGWRQVATRAGELLARRVHGNGEPVLFASNWSVASQLAWYAYPTPVQVPSERETQINRWYGKPNADSKGIMVVPAKYQAKRGRADRFERCEHLEDVPVVLRRRTATSYSLYWCESYLADGDR